MVWSHCYHPAICPPWLLAPCCSWIYMHMDQDVAGCSLYALILICGIYIWYHIHICSCIRIVPTMHPGPFPCWAPSAISNHPGKSIELRLSTWHGAAACNAVRPQLGTSGGNKHTWCQFFFLRASQDQNDFCVHNVLWVHVGSFHPYTFIYKYSIGCGGIPGKDDRKPMQLQVQLGPFFHAISSCCHWLLRHTKSEVIHEKNEIHVLINHMAPGTLMGNPWCHKRGIYQSSASATSLAFFLIAFSKALRSIPLDRKQKLLSTITKISKCGVNRGQFDISCVHLLPPYVQVSCLPWASKELSCAALKLGSVRDAGISDVRYSMCICFLSICQWKMIDKPTH